MAWADRGACRGEDQDLFYPPVPPEKITAAHVALARPICQACPVYTACHAHAVQRESDGIWAATSPKDRRRLRKAMGIPDISKTVDARSPDVAVGLVPDVAELTADGRSAAEIASILGITQWTVVRHRTARRKIA
jgi:hypothetical protein